MSLTRRLAGGVAVLTVSNGVVKMLAIVTMPVLTNLLSPQAYGVAALVSTVISLVSVFALAGIDVSYARAYHSARPPSGPVVEHFCWRFAGLSSLLAASVAAILWWAFGRDSSQLDAGLALLLAPGIVLSIGQTMAQTRGRLAGKYAAMAMSMILGGVANAGTSIAIAVWWRQDALALLLPMLLGYLVTPVLLGTPSISKLAKSADLTAVDGVTLIKIGLAAIVTAPMYWVLSSSDRWFLQYYRGAKAVGVYSIGYNVAIVGMMVNHAILSVWLPEASREFELNGGTAPVTLGRLMSRLIALMAVIWLAATAAGGDIVRWLANERFHAAASYVPYIAGASFFYGTSQLAMATLILANQFKWAVPWWFLGGLVSALLNFTLVPRYGGLGAAITQSISFAFISIGILLTAQAKFRIRLEWFRLLAAGSFAIVAGTFLAPSWHEVAHYSLLLKLPVGMFVAGAVAWLTAPDWCGRWFWYLCGKTMT